MWVKQNSVILWGLLFLFIFIFIYKNFNPSEYSYFPKCPFLQLTGYECPGCGSQRAAYYLLNFQWKSAWYANPLFMLAIPYMLLLILLNSARNKGKMIQVANAVNSQKAILFVLVLIMAFWILRNVI